MSHFLRGTVFFIKLTILVALGVLLAQNPGKAHLTWFGYHIEMSMGLLLAFLLFSVASLLLIMGAWRTFWRSPMIWAERRKKRHHQKGQTAFIEGMNALVGGEFSEALRLTKRATTFGFHHPLLHFLSAQAAHTSGKSEEASAYLAQLTQHPETRFLGLKGQIIQARHTHNWEQMRSLLQEALTIRPKSPWVLQQSLELDIRLNSFDKARTIVEQMHHRQLLTKTESRRKQGLIHWMQAELAEKEGDENLFIQAAARAHFEAPDISTIAVRLADYYHKIGKTSKAQKVLMVSYTYCPHPDFAEQLKALYPDLSTLEHYRNMEKLIEGAPQHPESLYILAKAAFEAKLWGQARHYLMILKDRAYSQRIAHLMIQVDMGENPNSLQTPSLSQEHFETIPPDPTWICQHCKATFSAWAPTCFSCETFDQIIWQLPVRSLSKNDATIALLE